MLTRTERLLRLRRVDGLPLGHLPGQFVQVSIFGLEEAPISICSSPVDDGSFEICVRRIGRVTKVLHELEAGAEIGTRGPFGHGFPVEEIAGRDVLFVAGGIGLAPLRSLVQWCVARRGQFGKLTLLNGAKGPAELLFDREYAQWRQAGNFDLQLTVDVADANWKGPVGLITKLIPPLDLDPARTSAAIVGPPVMYPYVLKELAAKGMKPENILLSLERHMRCGVGKCGHCMIDGLYCCCDGPVFKLSDLPDVRRAL